MFRRKKVYHGSPNENIEIFKPRIGSHGKPFVYASTNLTVALMFIQHIGGDFGCSPGIDRDGNPYLCERFENALEMRSGENKGYVYTLSMKHFFKGTGWPGEVVSKREVKPIHKEFVPNLIETLKNEDSEGRLHLYKYPKKPDNVPTDDSDLVRKAVIYYGSKENLPKQVGIWHPLLIKPIHDLMHKSPPQ